ncbi:MAG: STAS domain-containing protein [Bdellovibrionota bacterium]
MAKSSEDVTKLEFFLAEKGPILIVNLVGPLLKRNADYAEECIQAVSASSAKWVIMNFRDVPPVFDEEICASIYSSLKKAVWKKAGSIRLSAVHPELRKVLIKRGLLSEDEVANNLTEALQKLALTSVA